MGDLVDRLRSMARAFDGRPVGDLLAEAGNEIERLRAAAPALPSCAQPTEYRLSLLPEDHPERPRFTAWVTYHGDGEYWVSHFGGLVRLSIDGTWDESPRLKDRTSEWDARHRFDHDTALRLATEALGSIESGGKTAADVLAESEPPCNGVCLYATDIGVTANGIAYPHPDCPAHGSHEALDRWRRGESGPASEGHRDTGADR